MSVARFLSRSSLWWADPERCGDRKVAVGHGLAQQRTARTDWIYPEALGPKYAYFRNPKTTNCEDDLDTRFYAVQMTRPNGREGRPRGLRISDGFYIDVEDAARTSNGARPLAYFDMRRATVNDKPGLEITYWLLFGAGKSPDGSVHEGDWERIGVRVQRTGASKYLPKSLVLYSADRRRSFPWSEIQRAGGDSDGQQTHPVLISDLGTHRFRWGACSPCDRWDLRDRLVNAARQPWYGFGGAWGDVGRDSATTGSLGPNDGSWPTAREVELTPPGT
jgi:hypothetical protein